MAGFYAILQNGTPERLDAAARVLRCGGEHEVRAVEGFAFVWLGHDDPARFAPARDPKTGVRALAGGRVGWTAKFDAYCARAAIAPGMEDNTDRFGSDLESFALISAPNGDVRGRTQDQPNGEWGPQVCQRACLGNANCKAWTLVWAGVHQPNSVCHLKRTTPTPTPNACCVSGVTPSRMGPSGVSEPGPFGPTPPSAGSVASEPGGFAGVPTAAGCSPPFVQRKARPSDAVCVTRDSFATVQNENASAASRWDPNGAYGPNTCIAGFVWREAFDGDTVCITVERRAAVKEENRLAPTRAAAQEKPFEPGRTSPGALSQGGVKPVISFPENDTDRPGSDFESYRMDDAHHCRAACVGDKRCQAWTFVRAGIHGPTGVCYLKRPAPPPVHNTCCISGTVTR